MTQPVSSAVPPPVAPAVQPKKVRRRPPGLSLAAWRQFLQVAIPYWRGERKRSAWGLMALLILLMLAETHFAVRLNTQAGELTSALAAQDSSRFWGAVRACLGVLAFAVPIYAFYYFMRDAFANHWRKWLTGRFLDGYLGQRRYYALLNEGDIDNPDQRISEDINSFTGRSTHFLLIFIGSFMQLVAFSAVLWSISHKLVGFLIAYAVIGTVVALVVFGAPLIRLNFWQLRREADFRFSLMRVRENAESIAFYRGEAQERSQIDLRFEAVFQNFRQLIRKQRALNLFQRSFSQLTLVVPSVLLASEVLSGEMEVGRAVQAAGAFTAVLGAVALIVDNFESLSRFVAGIDRLHALSHALQPARSAPSEPQIERREGEHLAIEGLTLQTPQFGRVLIEGLDLAVKPGEALLISGASGCGKSSLLRAVAGLWRTGQGTIAHPPHDSMFFLPQQPYLQPGTLRSQLAYPATSTSLSDEQLQEILKEVQLGDLVQRVGGMDAAQDWEKLLSVGEQQRLAFARVLVQQPKVVILDEATSALDSANEAALYERLRETGTTLISIAHRPAVLRYHDHVLKLEGEGRWSLHDAKSFEFE